MGKLQSKPVMAVRGAGKTLTISYNALEEDWGRISPDESLDSSSCDFASTTCLLKGTELTLTRRSPHEFTLFASPRFPAPSSPSSPSSSIFSSLLSQSPPIDLSTSTPTVDVDASPTNLLSPCPASIPSPHPASHAAGAVLPHLPPLGAAPRPVSPRAAPHSEKTGAEPSFRFSIPASLPSPSPATGGAASLSPTSSATDSYPVQSLTSSRPSTDASTPPSTPFSPTPPTPPSPTPPPTPPPSPPSSPTPPTELAVEDVLKLEPLNWPSFVRQPATSPRPPPIRPPIAAVSPLKATEEGDRPPSVAQNSPQISPQGSPPNSPPNSPRKDEAAREIHFQQDDDGTLTVCIGDGALSHQDLAALVQTVFNSMPISPKNSKKSLKLKLMTPPTSSKGAASPESPPSLTKDLCAATVDAVSSGATPPLPPKKSTPSSREKNHSAREEKMGETTTTTTTAPKHSDVACTHPGCCARKNIDVQERLQQRSFSGPQQQQHARLGSAVQQRRGRNFRRFNSDKVRGVHFQTPTPSATPHNLPRFAQPHPPHPLQQLRQPPPPPPTPPGLAHHHPLRHWNIDTVAASIKNFGHAHHEAPVVGSATPQRRFVDAKIAYRHSVSDPQFADRLRAHEAFARHQHHHHHHHHRDGEGVWTPPLPAWVRRDAPPSSLAPLPSWAAPFSRARADNDRIVGAAMAPGRQPKTRAFFGATPDNFRQVHPSAGGVKKAPETTTTPISSAPRGFAEEEATPRMDAHETEMQWLEYRDQLEQHRNRERRRKAGREKVQNWMETTELFRDFPVDQPQQQQQRFVNLPQPRQEQPQTDAMVERHEHHHVHQHHHHHHHHHHVE